MPPMRDASGRFVSGGGSGVSVKTVFNERLIKRKMREASFDNLSRAGAYLRGVARRKIRRRKNPDLHSRPGAPPYTFTGKLKRSIWFHVDRSRECAIIGPAANWIGRIGALHEFGGKRRVWIPAAIKTTYRIGDIGPVSTRKYKRAYVSKNRQSYKDPHDGSAVAWVQITSAAQASHASRVAKRLRRAYGKFQNATYPARPYMGPALTETIPRLPKLWGNSVGSPD